MGVPREIREVPRPTNTVVIDYGEKHGRAFRYAVRSRTGVRYVHGKCPQPISGKVIGHIIDGAYVPLKPPLPDEPSFLSYGPSAFVDSVCQDLYQDLLATFPLREASQILTIASIKAITPAVRYSRIATEYENNWIRILHPGVPLSRNTICDLLKRVGMSGDNRQAFFMRRLNRVAKTHHLIIDGMLKNDTSIVNDFSAFSRKAKIKDCEEISLLYAYDLEKKEPVVSEVFPGNCIDATAFHSFLKENKIEKGILVADKGFPPSAIEADLKAHADLHFLTPLKRNDKRIKQFQMLDPQEVIPGFDDTLFGKKQKLSNGHFLYAFRSVEKAAVEEKTTARRAIHSGTFNPENYLEKRVAYGTIVFESDLDLSLSTVYQIYSARWEIELLFKGFKNEECLAETNVQSDFSVIGSEFVNFIATVMTSRMIQAAKAAGVLENRTISELLKDISRTFRLTKFKDENPVFADDGWMGPTPKSLAELVALGLCADDGSLQCRQALKRIAVAPKPKRRGRPPKQPEKIGEPTRAECTSNQSNQ